MSRSGLSDVRRDEELLALYREGRTAAAPPPEIDRAILAAARQAAAAPLRRPRPAWRSWLAPVSVAVVAVVGLTLSVRVAEEPPGRRLEAPAAPPAAAAPERADRPAAGADAPAPAKAKSAAAKPAPPPAQPASPRPAEVAPAAALPAAAPPALEPSRQPLADTAAPAPAAAAKRARRETLSGEAEAPAAGAASTAAQEATAPPRDADPARWLEQIRRLRAAGQTTEAAAELARFRRVHPQYPLPDDLTR